MQTLDAPIYEINQDSEWYKSALKRSEDINKFFMKFEEKYGIKEGFSFYHSEYFGVYEGTEAHDFFKGEILKNPKDGFYPFKKRSKYFDEIKSLIEDIEDVSPFKAHDVLGLNNISGSQWLGDRWFFGVKHKKYIKGDEVTSVDYKEYLKAVMNELD
ncbi:hypothetical protein [Metabacillus litoralis]|uniref:hypothetical protein n=1 Tax=Metabacillus litoralis TaxID=152268 RepID=UPI0020417FFF|nr:hypothetical protein [Metabacillus litoralis]MCM3413552.1 hypothetical protein [Metabacillus litoralis]